MIKSLKKFAALAALMGAAIVSDAQWYPGELNTLDGGARKFLLRWTSDMREFVCDRNAIKDRVARKVCLLDRSLHLKDPPFREEVQVQPNLTLRAILEPRGLHKTDKQIRVFKRSSVHQHSVPPNEQELTTFLNLVIEPGDIIIFMRVGLI